MNVQRISTLPTASEPVTAAELMAWARVTDPLDAPTFERLARVAREEVERFTGYVLVPGAFVVTSTWATRIAVPLTPIVALTEVRSIDGAGIVDVLDPASYVSLLTVAPALVVLSAYGWAAAAIEVEVAAGFVAVDDIPEELRQAVFDVALLHWTHRDDPELLDRVHAYLGTLSTTFGIVQV